MENQNLTRELAYDLLPLGEQFFDTLGLSKDSPEVQEREQLESCRRLSLAIFLSDSFDEYAEAITGVISKILLSRNEPDLDDDLKEAYITEREDLVRAALVVFSAHMLKDGMITRRDLDG